jgi:hypothetical protein
MIMGVFWSVIMFASFGTFMGYLGYQTFKKNEYYAYYNLGFSKVYLIKKVWLVNLAIAFLLLLIIIILN